MPANGPGGLGGIFSQVVMKPLGPKVDSLSSVSSTATVVAAGSERMRKHEENRNSRRSERGINAARTNTRMTIDIMTNVSTNIPKNQLKEIMTFTASTEGIPTKMSTAYGRLEERNSWFM